MNKIFICLLIMAGVLTGCTRYENPQPNFEDHELEDADGGIKRKVLVIAVDGLVGLELKKEVPANLSAMLQNAKYSYEGIADENTSDPASWTTLMTGVSVNRHHVVSDSYLPSHDPEHPHADNQFAPTIFYLIKEQDKRLPTTAITHSRELAYTLLLDAKESVVVNSDEAARDEAVDKLKEENATFVVVQFESLLEAGKNSSFSFDSQEYKAAVNKIDELIGDLKNAVEARETYDEEDWLIIVTSTHGGIGNSYGGSTLEERNIFMMYYNKNFVGQELNAESIYAPRFYGYNTTDENPTNAVRARNSTAAAGENNYNVAETGELTIEAKVKINQNANGGYDYSWPPFLSKVSARSGNNAGWSFFRTGTSVAFFVADGAAKIEIAGGPVSTDEIWTQIAGVFTSVDGVPTAKFYVNGTLAAEASANLNVANVLSTSPLTFGFQPEVFSSAYLDFYMSDVRIWNTALTDREIEENVSQMGVDEDHPKIANLVGHWMLDDGDKLFRNKISGMPNIPVAGTPVYRLFGNNMPNVDPRKSVLFKSQDLPTQVLYWLELDVNEDWQIEGNNFLKHFEIEFIK